MKSEDSDWPPIIHATHVTAFAPIRDAILTAIAWAALGFLLWELVYFLYDYLSYPFFELTRPHSLEWKPFRDRIGFFAIFALFLIATLACAGFCRRDDLKPGRRKAGTVAPLTLEEQAADFAIAPETLEEWRQHQVVVVHFDDDNKLSRITLKPPDPCAE
jgi:poly-beta-1,6-N-acetyl-D-glucosamine biosynthesis protein PgaD